MMSCDFESLSALDCQVVLIVVMCVCVPCHLKMFSFVFVCGCIKVVSIRNKGTKPQRVEVGCQFTVF